MGLKEWEGDAVRYTKQINAFSEAMGEWCFTGVAPDLLKKVIPGFK
jgi:hypothetical protein